MKPTEFSEEHDRGREEEDDLGTNIMKLGVTLWVLIIAAIIGGGWWIFHP